MSMELGRGMMTALPLSHKRRTAAPVRMAAPMKKRPPTDAATLLSGDKDSNGGNENIVNCFIIQNISKKTEHIKKNDVQFDAKVSSLCIKIEHQQSIKQKHIKLKVLRIDGGLSN